ncbi:MAG: arsenate reductase family protein [Arcobacteraceae bacterium]|nr:arsenate reductase family protein [Arcobacteraceae bacterium]
MQFTPNRYTIVFYEKKGCAGNQRQKKVLETHGLSYQTKSLLDAPWTKESLEPFFQGLNKSAMINQFAPKIKNSEINIEDYTKEELIKLMCEEPILIKRPLLQIGNHSMCGFDIEQINRLLDINICESISISTCQSEDPCKSV